MAEDLYEVQEQLNVLLRWLVAGHSTCIFTLIDYNLLVLLQHGVQKRVSQVFLVFQRLCKRVVV